MRRTRRENFLVGNLIYVITGILVIILLVLILGAVFGKSNKKQKDTGTIVDTDNNIDITKVKNELQEDTVPELSELIQQYYNAISACDITALEQIVSSISDDEKDIIRRKKDYIEGYNNIVVYSKLCPVDGSYLVFAGYDIKFKNEDTLVPGMETFYVRTSEEGNLYIYRGTDVEAEVQTFINEQTSSKEVQVLFDDVNQRYVDALASSPTLLEFIEGFEGDSDLIKEAKKKAAQAEALAQATEAAVQTSEEPQQTEEAQATEAAQPDAQTQTTDTNETVLVIASVNLRKGNDESAERITTMIVGDQATRIGVTDNGWSKVQYNGQEGYVKSDYVTTFHLTSDTVKTTTTINVRTEASETANMAGQVAVDSTLTRYAECDNGWSQIQYNGGVGYVKTEYLTK